MADRRTEPAPAPRQPGAGQVLVVAVAVVAVVLGAMVLTYLVPGLPAFVARTPIAIAVLIAGTAFVLWRITRRSG